MRLILCVDEEYGISFMGKRQSKDRLLRQDMLELTGKTPLWMAPSSAKQFEEAGSGLCVAEDFLSRTGAGEYAFTEGPLPEERVEQLILYHWNRHYPADRYFPKSLLEGRVCLSVKEFSGSSHERITREVYGPCV